MNCPSCRSPALVETDPSRHLCSCPICGLSCSKTEAAARPSEKSARTSANLARKLSEVRAGLEVDHLLSLPRGVYNIPVSNARTVYSYRGTPWITYDDDTPIEFGEKGITIG